MKIVKRVVRNVRATVVAIGGLGYTRIPVMMFALFVNICPFALALERGRQMGKPVREKMLRDLIPRFTGEGQASSLMDQLKGMDVRDASYSVQGDVVMLKSAHKTYIFSGVARDPTGKVSTLVSVYDSTGEKTKELNFSDVFTPNRNQISFLVSGHDRNIVEKGVIVGVKEKALAFMNVDEDMRPALVSFSQPEGQVAATSSLPIVTSLSDLDDGVGQVAVAVADDLLIIAVVVLFVLITCAIFGWWGC